MLLISRMICPRSGSTGDLLPAQCMDRSAGQTDLARIDRDAACSRLMHQVGRTGAGSRDSAPLAGGRRMLASRHHPCRAWSGPLAVRLDARNGQLVGDGGGWLAFYIRD